MDSDSDSLTPDRCEEGFGRRSIDVLPEEILEYILFKVSPYNDLKSAMLVCSSWYRIAKGNDKT